MAGRRKHDWLQLFSDFECCGQSQAEFCKQHGINPNYFSLKLSRHKAASKPVFSRVAIEPHDQKPQGVVIVEIGNCKIHYPATIP